MSGDAAIARARGATGAVFFCAGLSLACWAPLVPFAKARAGVDDGTLGALLLCLGLGSVMTMPLSGAFVARAGVRAPIAAGLIGLALALPVLAVAADVRLLAVALLLFGASLGLVDVAMNVEAVAVEARAGTPLMSGFHARFSLGGLAGAAAMTALLSAGLAPLAAVAAAIPLPVLAGIRALLRLLPAGSDGGATFALPHGRVVLTGVLALVAFLVEGAILDWGAVLLATTRDVPVARAGVGYVLFSASMVIGRLTGDRIVGALGGRRVLAGGGFAVAGGIVWMLTAPGTLAALGGFALAGFGAANIAPILFSAAGRQTAMPPAKAIAAMSTLGYAGVLVGPAAIGFASRAVGLGTAFAALAVLVLLVPMARRVAA